MGFRQVAFDQGRLDGGGGDDPFVDRDPATPFRSRKKPLRGHGDQTVGERPAEGGCIRACRLEEAVDRLFESAGPDAPALRRSLADRLVAVTAQRLLPRTEGRGRVPVYEWIVATPAIKAALIEGDLSEAQASDPECRTYEAALDALIGAGKVVS